MAQQAASQAERTSSTQQKPRPRRDLTAMEERRMRAADLFRKGVIPAEVARQLGVSHQIVSDWRKVWRQGGRAALRAKGQAGRPRKLSPAQLRKVEKALKKGAEANGYTGDLWTLPRAAEVIKQVTGVSYHPGYVWYLLRKQLGWTWQRPSRRAVARDDKANEAVGKAATEKRARRQRALIVFEDESGVSLLPSVRATWAPRGHTPVLRHPFNWKRLSLAAALVYEADGSDAHLVFELRPGAYNGELLIEFLSDLDDIEQRPVILIWDGLPAHRSRRMTDWVQSQRDWLSVEQLPGYAPDLNPLEQAWGNVKSQELANLCSDTIDEVATITEDGLDRIGTDANLCLAFLRHSGLRL